VQNRVRVLEHLFVAEANHRTAESLQVCGAGIIVLNLEGVTPSVNLNDKFGAGTTEIGDIAVDGMLAPELEAMKLLSPQPRP
jgi:hypothetical protein